MRTPSVHVCADLLGYVLQQQCRVWCYNEQTSYQDVTAAAADTACRYVSDFARPGCPQAQGCLPTRGLLASTDYQDARAILITPSFRINSRASKHTRQGTGAQESVRPVHAKTIWGRPCCELESLRTAIVTSCRDVYRCVAALHWDTIGKVLQHRSSGRHVARAASGAHYGIFGCTIASLHVQPGSVHRPSQAAGQAAEHGEGRDIFVVACQYWVVTPPAADHLQDPATSATVASLLTAGLEPSAQADDRHRSSLSCCRGPAGNCARDSRGPVSRHVRLLPCLNGPIRSVTLRHSKLVTS